MLHFCIMTHVAVVPRVSLTFPVCAVAVGMYKLEQGLVTMATVRKVEPHQGLSLHLPFENRGFASVTDLSDAYADKPLEPYKQGQLVR